MVYGRWEVGDGIWYMGGGIGIWDLEFGICLGFGSIWILEFI